MDTPDGQARNIPLKPEKQVFRADELSAHLAIYKEFIRLRLK